MIESGGHAGATTQRAYLVVARGHHELFDELTAVMGDLDWVEAIENRRHTATLLPRGEEAACR